MSTPLVSVVITNYNTGRYLPETLESVLAQTYPAVEIVVVDDGSTDDSLIRIEPYLGRIRLLQRPHGGLAAARNAGLAAAKGAYIALLDADDLWVPEKLAVQLEIAQRNPHSGMIVCNGTAFGSASSQPFLLYGAAVAALRSNGGEVSGRFHWQFIANVGIRCPAQTLIPRKVVDQIGAFGNFDSQDYDYYLRISARFPVTFHAHSLVRYRDREESMSGPYRQRALTWSRQKLAVLRSYSRRCEPQYRTAVARQLLRLRAEAALYHCVLLDRRHGRRALRLLAARHPWPPVALASLLLSPAPALARAANRFWAWCLA